MKVALMTKLAILSLIMTQSSALSAGTIPSCSAGGAVLQQNDSQVENWEDTTHTQFHGRAHIVGHIIQIFSNQTGHKHFGVQIGATPEDAVEIVYNEDFGALPQLTLGMTVEACGDYITVGHQSPDSAIVHWVHRSDTPAHESGYVALNGTVYGQD